jgi:hypothetical protein
LQHTRRWSHVAVDPDPHEQLQHPELHRFEEPHPVVHREQVALQSTM